MSSIVSSSRDHHSHRSSYSPLSEPINLLHGLTAADIHATAHTRHIRSQLPTYLSILISRPPDLISIITSLPTAIILPDAGYSTHSRNSGVKFQITALLQKNDGTMETILLSDVITVARSMIDSMVREWEKKDAERPSGKKKGGKEWRREIVARCEEVAVGEVWNKVHGMVEAKVEQRIKAKGMRFRSDGVKFMDLGEGLGA